MRVLTFLYLTFLYQLCEGAGNGKKVEDSKGTVTKADDSTKQAEATEVNTELLDVLSISKVEDALGEMNELLERVKRESAVAQNGPDDKAISRHHAPELPTGPLQDEPDKSL
ncbi:signal peptide-containing protein [Theileria equi strain WA]|uniref:Signal peptide-containing protein n=1 Tax=Theileria equi strain WA TaxID=1537102 RepID=L0AYA8_THEEQ|nr:signal peptide-containing protein [Theileria equi strain WA]AFZ79991.1 signal peptide-containing protein [Theileria equi strain WA]|eukprot:XP_004829657.1 signal peptide-containing protein [Theileria equi strain WA]